MKIKVCGMREPDNIRAVEQLGADWIGFIFYPKSSRYVSEMPAYLPTQAKRVGVFVDADVEEIKQKAATYALDFIQLHGHETPQYCKALQEYKLIKAFNIATADDLKQTEQYKGLAHYFLFDTKATLVGGNGTKFDWSILADYNGQTPFFLSGGIGPNDSERLRRFSHPRWAGIDLNSCFELAPAVKDTERLKQFINSL